MKDPRTWFSWEPPSGSLGSTSPSLVVGYRAGDTESWKRLMEIYGPVVYHVFLSHVPAQDRDDVFQEVFATAWRNRERFTKTPGRASFRAWLYQISGYLVSNYQRGRKRYQRVAPVGGCDHQEKMDQLASRDPVLAIAEKSGSGTGSAEDSWLNSLDTDQDIIVDGVRPDGEHIRVLVRQQVLGIVLEELENQRRTRDLALRQIINGESAEAAAVAGY